MEKVSILKQEWFAILMVVFVAPFGIFLMWKNKMFPVYARIILSIIFGGVFIFFLITLTVYPTSVNQTTGTSQAVQQEETADKVAADKVIADKVAADKVIADKVAADKVVADKITADQAAADKAAADKVAAAAEAAKPKQTMGQKNALGKAKEYLDYTAFSHNSLIEQLKYEGFSDEDAIYAADNCGADWNGQAAQKALEYLDYSSFSRSGLIDQLMYEGFTGDQAEYGATTVGY
ncbi:MAG: Ltp family lipoprotein [Acetobacterium sp.]